MTTIVLLKGIIYLLESFNDESFSIENCRSVTIMLVLRYDEFDTIIKNIERGKKAGQEKECTELMLSFSLQLASSFKRHYYLWKSFNEESFCVENCLSITILLALRYEEFDTIMNNIY